MILTPEKILKLKLYWDANRKRRYLRGSGINTFDDYLIARSHMPDKCQNCNMDDSLTCKGFINFRGGQIKYSCTWCYETVYVPLQRRPGPRMPPGHNRGMDRSRTYQGIADAMVDQWGRQA